MNHRRGGPPRCDAKKMTMRKLTYFDDDLVSRFDDDDEVVIPPTARQLRIARGQQNRRGKSASAVVRNYLESRRDHQLQRSAGGASSSTLILNLIKVPRGALFKKEYILQVIGQYVDDFKPILLKTEKNDLTFFVEDDETAQAIKAISRRVRHPQTNQLVSFLVSRVPAGFAPLSSNDKKALLEVMQTRYNSSEHALDLGELNLDKAFRESSMHISLNRNNVMMSVVDLIDKHFGDITALSVKGNRLRFLDYFANLTYRIKNIQILDLSSNQIDHITELEKLKGWPVHTLYFENNPVCATYASAEAYTSAIHRIFPKVTLLDGIPVERAKEVEMPKLDDEQYTIPTSKPSYFGTEARRALIEAFVVEYITIYDSPDPKNRKLLISAYDEDASFSLMAENLPDAHEKRPFFGNYKVYRWSSHNINYMDKWERFREKVLQKGAVDIVVELGKLPATKHLTDTFVLDISMATDKVICFALQGFFVDGEKQGIDDYKFFCRNFVVKCKGENKIAILSDMLFISGVFSERVQRYKALLSSLMKLPPNLDGETEQKAEVVGGQSSIPVTGAANMTAEATPQQIAASGDANMQQQMIDAFCKDSNMRPEWSRKCLEDQNWDYSAAGQAFLTVRERIPPEAFQS
uniref:Nuclear RNA export factor 1 n=1 Tax=Syphacia muris TaxID=451379 RepID=A0A0N5AK00_9BILA